MNTVVQTKPKLPGFISLLLVTILGVILAKLMWLIITPKNVTPTNIQVETSAASKPKAKVNYGKLIANHHLFGKVEIKKAPPKVEKTPEKVEEPVVAPTKLNLKLHGIVAYKSSKRGFALISSGSGSQKVYGKGDTLEEGVKVSEIFSAKVVIDNHGKTEELMLPVNEKRAPPKMQTTSFEMGGNAPPKKQKNNKLPSSVPPLAKGSPDLGSFRQEVLANPTKLMDIAKPSPAIVDGQFIGFRVQPGRQRKLFRKLGFRPNDIITEVNGIVIDDASKGAMILGELSQAADLSVKVKRGEQEIFIQHSF